MNEMGEGSLDVQTSSYNINESYDEMYSMANTANGNVTSLCGKRR